MALNPTFGKVEITALGMMPCIIVTISRLHLVGIPCFGPSQQAAQMEGSKAFSKDFMKRHNIPTAEYRSFTNYEDAKAYIDSIDHKVVIKADGLAAGKGVVIPTSNEEAQSALKQIMVNKEFGLAGKYSYCPTRSLLMTFRG
jgi:phosphoribosylamine-glycine ligase